MKKIIFLFAIFALCSIVTFAKGKVIGKYSSAYFNKTYEISVADIQKNEYQIYIEVQGEHEFIPIYVTVFYKNIDKFKKFLAEMKDKYIAWSNLASDNDVEYVVKDMKLKSPFVHAKWFFKDYWYSSAIHLRPDFIIKNGEKIVSIYDNVLAVRHQYGSADIEDEEKFFITFKNPDEIDELLSLFNDDNIKAAIEESKKADKLFK